MELMVRRASEFFIAVHKKEGFVMHVVLTKVGTNQKVDVKLGFSWTSLFFGPFVPLLRRDWKWLIVQIIVYDLFLKFLMPFFWIAWLVFAFMYNELYLRDLLAQKYQALEVDDQNRLKYRWSRPRKG